MDAMALSAALAVVASISLASLAAGFWFTFNDRERLLFEWGKVRAHCDEVFGLGGMGGCAVCAVAHIALFFAKVF